MIYVLYLKSAAARPPPELLTASTLPVVLIFAVIQQMCCEAAGDDDGRRSLSHLIAMVSRFLLTQSRIIFLAKATLSFLDPLSSSSLFSLRLCLLLRGLMCFSYRSSSLMNPIHILLQKQ